MRYLIIILLFFSCEYDGFTDLTPEDGFNTEFAFNVPALNRAISTEVATQDTGWHIVTDVPILVLSPFVDSIQFVSTDTFAFEWQDYDPVIKRVHRIANGFEPTLSEPNQTYAWSNTTQYYYNSDSYLIPMFNKDGYRYWLQVFREKISWYQTYYTARGIWAISKPKIIKGDVS